jgi:hypothetical protein
MRKYFTVVKWSVLEVAQTNMAVGMSAQHMRMDTYGCQPAAEQRRNRQEGFAAHLDLTERSLAVVIVVVVGALHCVADLHT